ncbi:MAG: cysteinyl-tRNA synthetase [Parcubacteria group bacterium Gr01-1014_3]|nr:MAG: cysteinyl-tRNA synthetase [Parcubacteria group bacterium Gr01-1014_3]
MQIFNSLSQTKEKLEDVITGKKVRLFVCGPTVYHDAHIGNARTYISFDIIARYLRSAGFRVYYLQNITDIDDKIIRRSAAENTTPQALAKKYEKIYHEDEKKLGIISVNKYARATSYIKQIVKQVQTLIDKGHAYKIDDGYYFDLSTFPDYGKLARRTVLQAEDSTSRIDENPNKKNRGDFVLWKFSSAQGGSSSGGKEGAAPTGGEPRPEAGREPSWNTKLGSGRPGWHIEDTAITEYQFGPQYDIHGGAIDLKFPHHEAEIAQQEAASGKKPMVKIWMHAGFLNIGGEKMSKSFGEFVTIREFLEKHSALVLRFMVASHHYRAPMDYSEALLRQSKNTLLNLMGFLGKLEMARGSAKALAAEELVKKMAEEFQAAMQDDFNTPEALAAIFSLINQFQKSVWELDKKSAKLITKSIVSSLEVLGLELPKVKIPSQIQKKVKERELYRGNAQFIPADTLRQEIEALGYTVDDTPRGPLVLPREITNS